MLSKYDIFCKVVEHSGFTKAANAIQYSQSAVSQTVKNLEQELGLTLLTRGKEGITKETMREFIAGLDIPRTPESTPCAHARHLHRQGRRTRPPLLIGASATFIISRARLRRPFRFGREKSERNGDGLHLQPHRETGTQLQTLHAFVRDE